MGARRNTHYLQTSHQSNLFLLSFQRTLPGAQCQKKKIPTWEYKSLIPARAATFLWISRPICQETNFREAQQLNNRPRTSKHLTTRHRWTSPQGREWPELLKQNPWWMGSRRSREWTSQCKSPRHSTTKQISTKSKSSSNSSSRVHMITKISQK